ncbi:MAG: hypothetical protein RNU03_11195 [Candidatus Sedimenticola sp. (ex Thyasira tokunagai)]
MANRNFFDRITQVVGDILEHPDPDLQPLKKPLADLSVEYHALQDSTSALSTELDLGDWVSTVIDYCDQLLAIGREQDPRQILGIDPSARYLFARIIYREFPRVAALFSLTGIIRVDDDQQPYVDVDRLSEFLRDPGNLVNEALWDALLADLGAGEDNGHLVAALIAMVILTPQTILALNSGDMTVSGPAKRSSDNDFWQAFYDATHGWYSLTIPLGDPTQNNPLPASIFDLHSALDPDFALTTALRSKRREVGGEKRTDFETWLAFTLKQDQWSYTLADDWVIRIKPGIVAGFGYDGGDQSWHGGFRAPTTSPNAALPSAANPIELTVSREVAGGSEPDFSFGPPFDTRLIIEDLLFYLRIRQQSPIFEIGVRMKGFDLVLPARFWRYFWGANNPLMRDGMRIGTDLELGYVESEGLLLNLGLDFATRFTVEKTFFDALTLHSVSLKADLDINGLDDISLILESRVHVSFDISVITGVVDGLGLSLGVAYDGSVTVPWDILPPTGIGLQLNLPPVSGGGYVDYTGGPTNKYAGVLYLKLWGYSAQAYGLYEETEEGDSSFLAMLAGQFPGIPLGYGFYLSGLGGIVGVNRAADTDMLRERLVSGSAGNVLFNDDPIRNAPSIIRDLDLLFPPTYGVHIAGPTARFHWLYLVHFDVGVLIEIRTSGQDKGLSKIVLLGCARSELEIIGLTLYRLRLEVVGVADFNIQLVAMDSSLIDSTLLGIFDLTGDSGFRLSYGSTPYAMMTMGGFHPEFNPEPARFPELTRMAITWGYDDGDDFLLRGESYYAIATTSLQFGGKLECWARKGKWRAEGWLSYDVLFQLNPFYFSFAFSVGFRVRYRGVSLCGVKVSGKLSGPGPLAVSAKFCVEILWTDFCVSASFNIGRAITQTVTTIHTLIDSMEDEVRSLANITSEITHDATVTLAPMLSSASRQVVLPLGGLIWNQSRLPLGLLVDKFEGADLNESREIRIQCLSSTGQSIANGQREEWFGAAQYLKLTDAEQLNLPSFQRMESGLSVGFGEVQPAGIDYELRKNVIRLPDEVPLSSFSNVVWPEVYDLLVDERLGKRGTYNNNARFKVNSPQWQYISRGGGTGVTHLTAAQAMQYAKHQGGHAIAASAVIDMEGF